MQPLGLCAMLVLAVSIAPAGAQTVDTVGTRAAGMAGAFTAVSDDASAAYWNPAGFASGAFYSLVIDRNSAELNTPANGPAGSRSALFLGLGTPAFALSYYRLHATAVTPLAVPTGGLASVQADTLVTHHTGLTVVQSVAPGVAVGATLKLVRGLASSAVRPASEREALLEDRGDLTTEGTTRADVDLGVMASAGKLKAGLTLRNASEPSFRTPGGGASLSLERQARAGVALTPVAGWIVAVDSDLLESHGPAGPIRTFAAGTEGRVHRKVIARGGFSVNTAGDRAPAISAGASFAATASLLIEVQATGGSDRAARGWGVAARFGY
jgi:F plasmid transfer operon, TraF, protein